MQIRDYFKPEVFGPREPTYLPLDPLVEFAIVVGSDGRPQRVRSQSRVLVPMLNWDQEREDDILISVLVQASSQKLFKAKNYDSLNPQLWAKLRFYLHGMVLNPEHKGGVEPPRETRVSYSLAVPVNKVLCLGGPGRVGSYLIQKHLRGAFCPQSQGVACIEIYRSA